MKRSKYNNESFRRNKEGSLTKNENHKIAIKNY
jgi:hypothetical protein